MPRIAKLLFDSESQASLEGLRALGGSERSLLFSAEGFSLDMVVFESAGLHVMHGQLISTNDERGVAGATVRVGETGEAVETDHFGQFSLSTMGPLDAQVVTAVADEVQIACTLPTVGAA